MEENNKPKELTEHSLEYYSKLGHKNEIDVPDIEDDVKEELNYLPGYNEYLRDRDRNSFE